MKRRLIDADALLRTLRDGRAEGIVRSLSDVIRLIERMAKRAEEDELEQVKRI